MSRSIQGDSDRGGRVTKSRYSPTSSSSCSVKTPSPPPPNPYPEFSISPKTTRKLSLQTYLATLPEWSSPTRLASLYSEFHRLKETNPYGYETNINWWRLVILGAARNGHFSMYQPYISTPPSRYSSMYSTQGDRPDAHQERYESTGATIGILELDLDYIVSKFHKDGRKPHSLPSVMMEMSRTGEVVLRSEFLPWAGVGWTGWIFHKVVAAPLLWSLKQLSLSDSRSPKYSSSPTLATTGMGSSGGATSGTLSAGNLGSAGRSSGTSLVMPGNHQPSSPSGQSRETYVILPFVQEAAARIITLQQETVNYHISDNLMTFVDFRQKFSRTALLPIRGKFSTADGTGSTLVLTDRDLEILLRYMQFELKVLVVGGLDATKQSNELQDHEMIIKFATKDAIRDKSRLSITAVDRGIIELRETCKRLDNQVQDIEERIAELTDKARTCVKKGQRSQAAFALRQKKVLEEVLNKRLKSLETVNSILLRIQSSETDAEILQSYKLGSNTLASVMATKGSDGKQVLSQHNVESTMDHLADVFADQQEVDQAMSIGADMLMESSTPSGMDEDELMAELDALADQKQIQSTTQAPEQRSSPVLATKRTTPPLSSPIPTQQHQRQPVAPNTSGKRVAEIPEEMFAKQRKVSQSSVQSHRRNSAEATTQSAVQASTPQQETSPLTLPEEDEQATINPSESASMEVELVTTVSNEPLELSSQDQRDLALMLSELQDINAPEDEPDMDSEPSIDREVEPTRESSKPHREKQQMMEAN
ncbi:hypothetical protein BG006_002714 [Podila minutissima]|uniref:Snf7-domain-containing protein n=1 Tax=Podila minutissima TaxID=64525 RepID=A0A9P5SNY1_9FUNG|nr:hypothetical protein BG006_002714 [Podila minutissima]